MKRDVGMDYDEPLGGSCPVGCWHFLVVHQAWHVWPLWRGKASSQRYKKETSQDCAVFDSILGPLSTFRIAFGPLFP